MKGILKEPITDESGSALILALILMSVLTVLAMTSAAMTSTEYKIVRNERIIQDNFNLAESAAMQGIERLKSTDADSLENMGSLPWLTKEGDGADMSDTDNWTATNSAEGYMDDENSDYAVRQVGVYRYTSLDMTNTSTLYEFASYGHGHANGGKVLVEVGYRVRY